MRQPIQAFAIVNLILAGFVILSSFATIRRQQISLRDIGSPPGRLQIERWSGPFFNEDGQKSAFQSLVSGDSPGGKRRLIDGIDPERILNPIPEKPIKKEVKPQLPEAETYIGANPDEKEVYVSPQERLASLVSKPIIHDSIETENAKARSHTHEEEHKLVRHGSKRKYMFSPNHDRDDEEDGSQESREQSDFESNRMLKEDGENGEQIGELDDVTSFTKGHAENEEHFHLDSSDESDALENLEKFREDEHSSVEDEEQTDKDKDAERGEDDRENDSKRRSKIVRSGKAMPRSFIKSKDLASPVTQGRFRRSLISSLKNIRKTKISAVSKNSDDLSPFDNRISSHDSAWQDTPTPESTLAHHHSNKKSVTSNVETHKSNAAESHQKRSLKSKEKGTLVSSADAEAIKPKNKKSEVTSTITTSNVAKAPVAEKGINSEGKSLKRYFGSTEHQSGFLEENAADEIDGHMGGYMGDVPHLMTIGTHDGSDMHKEWNNMHSPGNGFYSGAGVGPARTQEGEYIHHNQDDGEEGMHADAFGGFGHLSHPYGGGHGLDYGIHHGAGWGIHGMGHSMGYGGEHAIVGAGIGYHHNANGVEGDVLHSLGGSTAISDHHTADVIDGIWGHDESDDHVGRRKHHHGSEGMVSYFGHNDHGALLPTETLDGFVDHWDHGGAIGHDWNDGYAGAVTGHEGIAHGKLRAIQAIQDDPNIDNELQTFGIGTEVAGHHGHHNLRGGGHHGIGLPSFDHHDIGMYGHSLGHGGHGHYGLGHDYHHGFRPGHGNYQFLEHGHAAITPVDMHHHDEMSPEEYHAHIDSLMQRYHHLEEDMRGQHGGLMDHLDEHLLHQHGHPHYHSGYDLYAYKNPWDNVRLPYHVPVENHPMMDEEAPEPGGGSIELGGKGDNKGEEKGGPLVEAKPDEPESKPPEKSKKKDKPKPKPKPKPVKQLPDWTGAPPRIPDQRGGPQISGSIGLGETESLPSSAKMGSALQQAIAAYKSMNLTVPPALQIQALQEQLKEAEEKNNLLLGQASKVTDTQTPSGDVAGETTTSARMNDTSGPSSDNEENEPAETKTKRPEKQSAVKIPESDVARLIPQVGTNAAAKLNGLKQIDVLQQSLKNMLTNAAVTANHDSEKVSDEKALLLQPSNTHSDSAAQQKATCGGRSCVPEVDDGDKDNSETATASTGADGHGLDKGGLQGLLANMYMNQGALKTSPSKGNPLTPTIDETGTDSEDGTSSLSETSVKESDAAADGSLARLLSSVGLGAGKRGRAKKKHNKNNTSDSPYSRIGYEESSNADTSKISFANSLALGQRSETSTPSSAQAVEEISQTHSPIEAPFSTDEDGVFSKKAEIKEASKKSR